MVGYQNIHARGVYISIFIQTWGNNMDREMSVELISYKNISDYTPHVGDIIIKHGWIFRTKWFGVVNGISNDHTLNIIIEGSPLLLVTTRPIMFDKKSINLSIVEIIDSNRGSYSVMQLDPQMNRPVWYV